MLTMVYFRPMGAMGNLGKTIVPMVKSYLLVLYFICSNSLMIIGGAMLIFSGIPRYNCNLRYSID